MTLTTQLIPLRNFFLVVFRDLVKCPLAWKMWCLKGLKSHIQRISNDFTWRTNSYRRFNFNIFLLSIIFNNVLFKRHRFRSFAVQLSYRFNHFLEMFCNFLGLISNVLKLLSNLRGFSKDLLIILQFFSVDLLMNLQFFSDNEFLRKFITKLDDSRGLLWLVIISKHRLV